MKKARTTIGIDSQVLRAEDARAARLGIGRSDRIEEVLRRDLGFDVLERLWATSDVAEVDATTLALEGHT